MEKKPYTPPKFTEVLAECASALPYIVNFDRDCGTCLQTRDVPMMLKYRDSLNAQDRMEIDMSIDYSIFFAYMQIILSHNFTRQIDWFPYN